MSLKLAHETCGTFHNMTALSVFSASFSGLIAIPTVPINLLILYSIITARKDSKVKYKLFFYKLLINIAFADLLKGILAGTSSVVFHVKEALGYIEDFALDAPIVHLTLLITDSAALVSVTVLSADRVIALYCPIKYRIGISSQRENLILALTWPIALCIVIPYFQFNYIKELAIFAGITITVSIGSLIVLTVSFQSKFQLKKRSSFMNSHISSDASMCKNSRNSRGLSHSFLNAKSPRHEEYQVSSHEQIEQKLSGDSVSSSMSANSQVYMIKLKDQKNGFIHKDLVFTDIESKNQNGSLLNDIKVTENMKNNDSRPKSNTLEIPLVKLTNKKARTLSDPTNGESKHDYSDNNRETSEEFYSSVIKNKKAGEDYSPQHRERSMSTLSTNGKGILSRQEKKVTRTFIKMLLVFLATYLPISLIVIYMNLSETTYIHCVVRHVLRDFTVILILASSLFRGINFIVTLRHLRRTVKKLLNCK